MNIPDDQEIMLFDGVCNFCNSWVQFILRHEKNTDLKFASLQSATGKELLKKHNLLDKGIESVVYIHKGKAYTKTAAVLRLTRRLKGLIPLLFVFILVPPFIRNAVYDYVARNRYKWYGKKDFCMIPTAEQRSRFIDL